MRYSSVVITTAADGSQTVYRRGRKMKFTLTPSVNSNSGVKVQLEELPEVAEAECDSSAIERLSLQSSVQSEVVPHAPHGSTSHFA